jgi:hypothetical protein
MVTMKIVASRVPPRPRLRFDSPPPPRCCVEKSRPRSASCESPMVVSAQAIMITEIT